MRDRREKPFGRAASLSPWLFQISICSPSPSKSGVRVVDVKKPGAVFAPGAEFHFAAEMPGHQLHPVADAEHGNA